VRLPEGWITARLGEIRVDHSRSIDPRKEPNQIFELYSIPSFADGKPEFAKGSEIGSTKKTLVPGTVVVSKINPRINRVWVVGNYSVHQKIGSGEWIPFFPVDGIQPEYLAYYLRRNEFREYLATRVSGVGGSLMRVKPSTLADYPLVLPSPQHQHRIVEAIESYLTRLDTAVASLERVQKNLKRYRASVLKSAVAGRLVPTEAELARKEGRSYEPANELLNRILVERKQRWIDDSTEKACAKAEAKACAAGKRWTAEDDAKALEKARKTAKAKYEEPDPPNTTDLHDLPDCWSWVRAEQVCAFITKGTTPAKSKMSAGKGDIPFIKVYNLAFDGTLDFSIDPTFVDLETHKGFLARSAVMPGDVLINIVGPPLGKTAIVSSTYSEWNINQAIARFRPMCGVIPEYLEAVLGSRFFLDWASGRSKATAGQFNLTLEICRDAPIPLPPDSEQIRITRELAVLSTIEKGIANLVDSCLVRSSRLRQSILKWAFEGKLVDQDPNDEPASVLLERIKAGQESIQPRKRHRTGKRKNVNTVKHDEQLDLLGGSNT